MSSDRVAVGVELEAQRFFRRTSWFAASASAPARSSTSRVHSVRLGTSSGRWEPAPPPTFRWAEAVAASDAPPPRHDASGGALRKADGAAFADLDPGTRAPAPKP
jgi:hypothetical protein